MSVSRSRMLLVGIALAVAGLLAALVPATSGIAGAATTPAAVAAQAEANVAAKAARNYYGAIALAYTGGAVGWSYDYSTKRSALNRAQRECKSASNFPSSCHKIAWVRNGCLALAVRWNGSNIAHWGWGSASSKRAAYNRALDECGSNCRKRAYTCTTR